MAKRAKLLVKKWLQLVSNDVKSIGKKAVDSPKDNSRSSTPVLNGAVDASDVPLERPNSRTNIWSKKGVKRKRTSRSAENSPLLPVIGQNEPKPKDSQEIVNNTDNSLLEQPLPSNALNHVKNMEISDGSNSHLEISHCLHSGNTSYRDNVIEAPLTDSVSTENSPLLPSTNIVTSDAENGCVSPDTENDKCKLDASLVKAEENNIGPVPYTAEHGSPPVSESITIDPAKYIEEETLNVQRKALPASCVDPETEADGLNGCYGDNNSWYDWTEVMPQNEGNLNILPYVILN